MFFGTCDGRCEERIVLKNQEGEDEEFCFVS
jgi:hypothetical protein